MGRLDRILSPIKKIPTNPIESMFGVGMGNASTSFLGKHLAGEYVGEIPTFMAFNNLMGEIGLLGTLLVIVLFIRIFFDALKVLKSLKFLTISMLDKLQLFRLR